MDIIYASLHRRQQAAPEPAAEVAEVLGALWAHATPGDGLEHVTGRPEADRIDLLMYLATATATRPVADAPCRAEALLTRCHDASPLLRRRYLPPRTATA
ncbi:hypothetical protein ACFP3U_11585 [Kitasatospora misakiensis]|uniref:Uncharacterized protein n=1 Tax=Kitasatospora misakiensis TaxID=67330 RepID=A0ABW0WZJ9_9ACTN